MTRITQRRLLTAMMLLVSSFIHAQEAVLTFDAFMAQVYKYHPYVKQAKLLRGMGKEGVRIAQGSFDPSLSTQISSKQTQGNNSYTYFEPSVKIPTRIGADIKAGMDQSSGIAVNPEMAKFDPVTGNAKNVQYQLFYAGVSVPLLRGMLTDERRNQLRQARLGLEMNEAEQVSQVNKVLLSATKVYWEWQQSYVKRRIVQENLQLAFDRKNFITRRIQGGEEKPIDSVEAWMEYRRRDGLLVEADMEFRNNGIELSNYLWDEDGNPVSLTNQVIPSMVGSERVAITSDSLQALTSYAEKSHPDVLKLNLKLRQTELERRLAAEFVKPVLNVDYYPFQTYTAGSRDDVNGLFMKNYKFGASFYSSLYLRKERGKLALSNYKVKQGEYLLQGGKRETGNRIIEAFNEMNMYDRLLGIQNDLVKDATSMRNAEEARFEAGESSLFLMNQRERALLEAQSKQAELLAKYAKSKYALWFTAGLQWKE